jgi:hypothetical protein
MPKGFGGVRQASAEVESRRGSGKSALFFKLAAGQETEVRFLEQDDDVAYCYVHYVPVEGRAWGRPVACLDQEKDGTPCPGCERGMDRKFLGYINLVWFDAPVYKRDTEGKIVKDRLNDPVVQGVKPQVALWSSGIRLFEELDEINTNFKGLRSRRFKVKRKGEGLNTKYAIGPVDVDSGPQEFTSEERKLEDEKYDLVEWTTPGSYEDFLKELGEHLPDSDRNGGEAPRRNPFKKS